MNNDFQYPSVNVRPNTIDELCISSLWNFSYYLLWLEICVFHSHLINMNRRRYSIDATINSVKTHSNDDYMNIYCGEMIHPKSSSKGFKLGTIYYDEFSL